MKNSKIYVINTISKIKTLFLFFYINFFDLNSYNEYD